MLKTQIKRILIIFMFALLIGVFSASDVLAYFQRSFADDGSSDKSGIVNIGQWSSSNNTPDGITLFDPNTLYSNGDLVWYEGFIYIYKGYTPTATDAPTVLNNWTILNDVNWYPTVTYYTGEVVSYDGILYTADWEHMNSEPGTEAFGPWNSLMPEEISWTVGQATTLNQVVYYNNQLYIYKDNYTQTEPGTTPEWGTPNDLTYSEYFVYEGGEIVLYNGSYYLSNYYSKGSIPTNGGAWSPYTVDTWNVNTVYHNMLYAEHNGVIYKALNSNRNKLKAEPGTIEGQLVWKAYDTFDYIQYNNYSNGEFVLYNGDYWYLANSNNSTLLPGTAPDSWNNVGTLEYNAFTTYVLDQYVYYNNDVYRVVNATNANLYAPEVVTDSWNLVTGYDWYWFNTYYSGNIVYYNGTVYTATVQTNAEPGTNSDWIIVS